MPRHEATPLDSFPDFFQEDESRVRVGHAAENFAVLRHMALNLLRQERTAKLGLKAKRLKAAWDDAFRLKVLASGNAIALPPIRGPLPATGA